MNEPSHSPSPMPSVEEIQAALNVSVRLLDPGIAPRDFGYAAEVLASGDTARPLSSDEALRALALQQFGNDRELAEIGLMVARANTPAPQAAHAAHWNFHNIARGLMQERGISEWGSLVMIGPVRVELARRALSPDTITSQYERIFRIQYRTMINMLLFAPKRQMARMVNSVKVFSGPNLHEVARMKYQVPTEDTASVGELAEASALQLQAITAPLAASFVQMLTPHLYAIWGEAGYIAVKDRLTVEHFVAQAQAARAE